MRSDRRVQAADRRSRRRAGRYLSSVGVAVVLAGLACSTSLAAGHGTVVGPRGKAAGGGYAHWLAVRNRLLFDTAAPGPPVCGTQRGPAGPIAFLLGGGHDRHDFSCSEPAGRPVYVGGLTNECSTISGDHKGYGTTNGELARCARRGYQGLRTSAKLDGARVASFDKLIIQAPPITFHVPRNNPFGIKPQSGRSVAYGSGLLLSGLTAGTHTIRISERFPPPHQSDSNTVTYVLHVTRHHG